MEGTVTISLNDFEYLQWQEARRKELLQMMENCILCSKKRKVVMDIVMTNELKEFIIDWFQEEYDFSVIEGGMENES